MSQAAVQENGDLLTRLPVVGFGSDNKRKIYESFKCPSELAAKHNVSDERTDDLLKHFVHHEMDFEMLHTGAEKLTIDLCRNCLKNKQYEDVEICKGNV